jgi:hypothetical protein
MWGNRVGSTKAVRMALAVAAITTVGLGIAATPASADDGLSTQCSGTLGADTVSSVIVPEDASCLLDDTTVSGDVVVGIDATLTASAGATIQGMVIRPTDCTSTLGAVTLANVVVPDGATCTLNGTIVTGSIKIGTGSSLFTTGATVGGNVQGTDGPQTVSLLDTNIGLSVHIEQAIGRITIGDAGCAIDPTVGIDVNLQNNHGLIALCYLSVGNNIILQGNARTMGIFHNEIGNNLIVQDNASRYIRVRYNHVGFSGGGGVNFQDNAGQGYLWRNNVGNAINCTGNRLTPIGSHNLAGSGLNDQCSTLG